MLTRQPFAPAAAFNDQRPGTLTNDHDFIEPGQRVRHPHKPEWGVGQVQSSIGGRVTVNFEHAGKILINARVIALVIVEPAPRD